MYCSYSSLLSDIYFVWPFVIADCPTYFSSENMTLTFIIITVYSPGEKGAKIDNWDIIFGCH